MPVTTVPSDPWLAEFLRHLLRHRRAISYNGKLVVEVSEDDGEEHIDVRFDSAFRSGPTALFTITSSRWVRLVIYSNKKKSLRKKFIQLDGWLKEVDAETIASTLVITLRDCGLLDHTKLATAVRAEVTNSWTSILHELPER